MTKAPVGHIGSRGVIVVDAARGLVVRDSGQGGFFTTTYAGRRRGMRRYLPSPAFEIRCGGRFLLEEFIEGKNLSVAPEPLAIAVASDVLDRLSKLARGSEERSQFGGSNLIKRLSAGSSLFGKALIMLEQHPDMLAALGHARLVPSHGDLHSDNICIGQQRILVLDWDPRLVGLAPPLADPIALLLSRSSTLRRNYWHGTFDANLASLLALVGIEPILTDDRRFLLALLGFLPFLELRSGILTGGNPQAEREFRSWIDGSPLRLK
jgi:hypothetical protein